MVEEAPPAKGDSLRERKPYKITPLGQRIHSMIKYAVRMEVFATNPFVARNLYLLEPSRVFSFLSSYPSREKRELLLKEGGFSKEDWEKANACGLIEHIKPKVPPIDIVYDRVTLPGQRCRRDLDYQVAI